MRTLRVIYTMMIILEVDTTIDPTLTLDTTVSKKLHDIINHEPALYLDDLNILSIGTDDNNE